MSDYVENTKLAIVGVVAMGIIAIFVPIGVAATEVVKLIAVGLIGYIARGKDNN